MNREVENRSRAERMPRASRKVRREDMRVNAEFARIERDLGPRRGTEPGKTRPVLIVQAQALIDAGHPSTLIIPLTTNLIGGTEPLRIRVPAQSSLRRDSDLLIDQLRAIDNRRLVEGRSPSTMRSWPASRQRCAEVLDLV